MTNLDIIKYLALNNPTRLAELLDDIYCCAWNCGSYARSSGEGKILEECEMEFAESEWLNQEADEDFFLDCELKEWTKATQKFSHIKIYVDNKPCLEVTPDGILFENGVETINQAIDEIKLLETLVNVDKYPDSVYNSFRKEVCTGCSDPNCLKSQVEIYDCPKFENYYAV